VTNDKVLVTNSNCTMVFNSVKYVSSDKFVLDSPRGVVKVNSDLYNVFFLIRLRLFDFIQVLLQFGIVGR